ncbi:hypothetical protein L2E82_27174 [Cichorium intybus]|uniref:Uncharacterized protein n=1 Tax=Cichorium intybus TaxID=13427 RepID=A0ACB9CS91_CICIN|nr:hypothetical protein L2E82_27174 [Cichorium intybus]
MAAETDTGSVVQLEKQETDDTTKKLEKMNISFSIWPPTQRTRDAVTKGLVSTLSTTSILSKRYGTVPTEEATAIAERIENEAFVAASASFPSADDDGIEVLQTYSKEISKRMLDYMKSRSDLPVAASTLDEERVATATTAVDSAGQDDESSTV